jgi:hypothetical protein
MSAPQNPNQSPPGPFGAPEPTIAIGQGCQAPQQYGQMPRQW